MITWVRNNGTLTTLLLTMIGSAIVLYFDVQQLKAQSGKWESKINEVEKKINNSVNQPELNTLKINQLSKDIKEFQDQYDKDRDLIIKLLIDIKQKE